MSPAIQVDQTCPRCRTVFGVWMYHYPRDPDGWQPANGDRTDCPNPECGYVFGDPLPGAGWCADCFSGDVLVRAVDGGRCAVCVAEAA